MPRPKKASHAPGGGGRGQPSIDLSRHVATKIAIFANRMSRAASRFYRERYGIGVVEWRVMMFIGHADETSANRICRETDLDKGAVSRSLNVLARLGIISVTEDGTDSRRHNVALTAKGRAMHDRIVPIALERQRELLSDLSPAEVEAFMDMIQRMQTKIVGGRSSPERPSFQRAGGKRATVTRAPRRDVLPKRHASAPRG